VIRAPTLEPRPVYPADGTRPAGVDPLPAEPPGPDPGAQTATQSRAKPTHRADIQGLRAVAVLLVVLFHAGVPVIHGGYVGVDVFFVLSGFLITSLLIRERTMTGANSLLQFYARRMRRILPMATLVIVVTLIASDVLLGFIRTRAVADDAGWSAAFSANLHFAIQGTNYLNAQLPPSPLQHYWSLAIEEQFYLLWPTLFVLIGFASRRRGFRLKLAGVLAVLAGTSFVWSVIETGHGATWAYFSPLSRGWELAFGALLGAQRRTLRDPYTVGGGWWGSWGLPAPSLPPRHSPAGRWRCPWLRRDARSPAARSAAREEPMHYCACGHSKQLAIGPTPCIYGIGRC
jgi:peptidoglycan/LPS O-acetylase OafA/YrhL